MANVFSLDALREAAQEDFADLVIPVSDEHSITLLNPMRLSESQREELRDYFAQLSKSDLAEGEEGSEEPAQGEDETEGQTMFDVIAAILVRVASEREDGEYLIKSIGDDRPLLLTVFNKWNEQTQAGEA